VIVPEELRKVELKFLLGSDPTALVFGCAPDAKIHGLPLAAASLS
jgi:hypothetical protein